MPRIQRRKIRKISAVKPKKAESKTEEKIKNDNDTESLDSEEDVMAPEPRKGIEITPLISEQIKDRYQDLIKELWNNEKKVGEFELPPELKASLNERMKLWLEYFITNATFRTPNANLFEYLDTFTATTSFI